MFLFFNEPDSILNVTGWPARFLSTCCCCCCVGRRSCSALRWPIVVRRHLQVHLRVPLLRTPPPPDLPSCAGIWLSRSRSRLKRSDGWKRNLVKVFPEKECKIVRYLLSVIYKKFFQTVLLPNFPSLSILKIGALQYFSIYGTAVSMIAYRSKK